MRFPGRRTESPRRPDGFDPGVLKTEAGILAPCTPNPRSTPFRRDVGQHQRRAPTRAGWPPEKPHRHHLLCLRIARELARERLPRIERQLVHPKEILLEHFLRPLIDRCEIGTLEPPGATNLEELDDRWQRMPPVIGIEAFVCFEGDPERRRLGAGLLLLPMCASEQSCAQRYKPPPLTVVSRCQSRPPSSPGARPRVR